MMDKENSRQSTRVTDQQTNNIHVSNRYYSPQGWRATLIYENQMELIQQDCWSDKEAEMTSNAKEIKAIYYELIRFEQVFKKMQDQAVLIHSDNTTAVYNIEKWKAKEFLIERLEQLIDLNNRLTLETTKIKRLHIEERNDLNDLQRIKL
ncbi:MAG: hypothetical protein EZS28_022305 [Streblomastix strix]|uniref:Reverse transcriptase RNase H-like domain-containing protein n=1 Tax=Streblomastix strix TaxID=222440 RepID=A0A5J4VIE7_9EUKA|nr:MAG: hypothetical protein EZS28_022305 [Streblomastix strix]